MPENSVPYPTPCAGYATHVLGEDDSRLASAARTMATLRIHLVIGVCRLRGITRIRRQLPDCGRDPYQLPLAYWDWRD